MNYNDDNVKRDEREFIRRCLLEDSKNRKKYLEIRIKRGIVTDQVILEQNLPSKEGENMPTTKDNRIVTSVDIDTAKVNTEDEITVTTVKPIEVDAVEVDENVVHVPTPEELEKERILQEKALEKEKQRLAREAEKQKERERIAKEKAKQKEKERLAKEKEKQKEKERIAREKQKEKEKLAREKEKQKEKERLAKEKEKQREKDRIAREKQKQLEKERLAKERAIQKQKEKEEQALLKKQEAEAALNQAEAEDTSTPDAKKPLPKKTTIADLNTENVVLATEETDPQDVETVDVVDSEPTTIDGRPVDNIARLRQKMLAQKRLERELMEKDAKVQPTSVETRYVPIDDEEEYEEEDSAELIEARKVIEELREENSDLFEQVSTLTDENKQLKSAKDKEIEAVHLSYVEEISDLKAEIDELKAEQQSEAQLDDNDYENIIAEKDQEIERLNKLVDQLDTVISEKDNQIKDSEKYIEALETEINELKEELENIETDDDNEEVDQLLTEIEVLKKNHAKEIEKVHESYVDEISDLQSEIDELKAENTDSLKEEIAQKDSEITELQKQVTELEQSQTEAQEQINKVEALQKELEEKDEQLVTTQTLLDEAEEAMQTVVVLQNRVSELEQQLNSNAESQEQLVNDDLAEKDEIIEQLQLQVAALEASEKEALEKASKVDELEKQLAEANQTILVIAEMQKQLNELQEKVASQDELLAQLQEKDLEIASLQEQLAASEESAQVDEEAMVTDIVEDPDVVAFNNEIAQKIEQLEADISMKDQQLLVLTEKFNSLREEDIIDPEFKRKIREIRDMKKEVIENSKVDRSNLQTNVDNIEHDLEKRREVFNEVSGRLEALDKENEKLSSRTSLSRENYLAKRSVIMSEYSAIKERVKALEEEYQIAVFKLNAAIANAEEILARLNQTESEIIEQYMQQLRAEHIDNDDDYLTKVEEKGALIKQLEELTMLYQQTQNAIQVNHQLLSETLESNRVLRERLLADEVVDIDQRIDSQIQLINELTNQYNTLAGKINLIKRKQEERIVSENKLRTTEEAIIVYSNLNEEQSLLLSSYYENNEKIVAYKAEISALVNEGKVAEAEAIRVTLSDLLIIQGDLYTKIEYMKHQIADISDNERVKYYIRLVKSMEQLRVKNIELRLEAATLKEDINIKKKELDILKEEKNKLS